MLHQQDQGRKGRQHQVQADRGGQLRTFGFYLDSRNGKCGSDAVDKRSHEHAQHDLGSTIAEEEPQQKREPYWAATVESGKVISVKTMPAVANTVEATLRRAVRSSPTVPARTKRLLCKASLGMRSSIPYITHASSTAPIAMTVGINQKLTFKRSQVYRGVTLRIARVLMRHLAMRLIPGMQRSASDTQRPRTVRPPG